MILQLLTIIVSNVFMGQKKSLEVVIIRNTAATMLITDGYYEIRSDLPWIFGDFDGNRAESLQ